MPLLIIPNIITMEILFSGNFVVKLPYAGKLPQIYPVGESFSIPFQLWNYESDKKL